MNIIIGFSRAKSPWKIGSLFIREVEKRNFSHAYIKMDILSTGIPMVAQASHGTVNVINYEIFKKDSIVVEEYIINCSDKDYSEILTFISNNAGKPYGVFQLVLIGVKKLFHIELDIRNRDSKYICSELAARIAGIAGVNVPELLDYTTPSDLNTLLKELGYGKI